LFEVFIIFTNFLIVIILRLAFRRIQLLKNTPRFWTRTIKTISKTPLIPPYLINLELGVIPLSFQSYFLFFINCLKSLLLLKYDFSPIHYFIRRNRSIHRRSHRSERRHRPVILYYIQLQRMNWVVSDVYGRRVAKSMHWWKCEDRCGKQLFKTFFRRKLWWEWVGIYLFRSFLKTILFFGLAGGYLTLIMGTLIFGDLRDLLEAGWQAAIWG